MKILLTAQQIEQTLNRLLEEITAQLSDDVEMVIIGIRSRGEILAQRLCKKLSERLGKTIPCGTLDITLYRDDLNDPKGTAQPRVRSTEIHFDIDDKIVLLVDDVLYTGRSVRAAMDALTDIGRPKAVRLAVLVDRGCRELPIGCDFSGLSVNITPRQAVRVFLEETDGRDEVIVE